MPCFHPLKAFQDVFPDFDGKRKVWFREPTGRMVTPLNLPCGQCVGCRVSRSREWALRCCHEATLHERNAFITLTYRGECLPPDGSLDYRHFQLFMKRLRKALYPLEIRYYMCGEYGDKRRRPHYHAIIFGYDFSDDRELVSNKRGNPLFRSQLLDDTWQLGHAWIGAVTFQSAAYVARYIMKKRTGKESENHYKEVNTETGEINDLRPEFTKMSLKPGIGAGWADKFLDDVYPDDFIVLEGKKLRSPRYYDKLLSRKNPLLLENVKRERKLKAEAVVSNETRARREVREQVLISKIDRLKRDLE